jgi:hypothetical protein
MVCLLSWSPCGDTRFLVERLSLENVPQRIVKAHVDLERFVFELAALRHVYRKRMRKPRASIAPRNWTMSRT